MKSSEILAILEYMEKEKGIQRADMISAITQALQAAAQKGIHAGQQFKFEINPKTGALKAWALYTIVDSFSDPQTEIHIEKAYDFVENPVLGETVQKEVDLSLLGRIGAQATKQAILQKVRYFEKERIYDDYRTLIGQIVSGKILRMEKEDFIVDLGKAEARLPRSGFIPREKYITGDSMRFLLESIQNTLRGPELILSRSNVDFVKRLFELEVSELADQTIAIKYIERVAGYRTKMVVASKNSKVDPVGSCVGTRGSRVKSIMKEFGDKEKIDVIRYSEDIKRLAEDILTPIVPKRSIINMQSKHIEFHISGDDLGLSFGQAGRNERLIAKLMAQMGYTVSFIAEAKEQVAGFEQRMKKAVQGLHQVPGIEDAIAERLVNMGITTPEAFEGVTAADLTEGGFTAEEAQTILDQINAFRSQQELAKNQ